MFLVASKYQYKIILANTYLNTVLKIRISKNLREKVTNLQERSHKFTWKKVRNVWGKKSQMYQEKSQFYRKKSQIFEKVFNKFTWKNVIYMNKNDLWEKMSWFMTSQIYKNKVRNDWGKKSQIYQEKLQFYRKKSQIFEKKVTNLHEKM